MREPLLRSAMRAPGLNRVVGEGDLGLLSLDLLVLGPGESFTLATGECEVAAVILGGQASIEGHGLKCTLSRKDVFSERASAALLPRDSEARFTAARQTEIALCKSKTGRAGEAFLVAPENTREKTVGRDNWERKVVDIISSDAPATKLVVGETFNRPGCWSSFPPHKHDETVPGEEVSMEEIYLFRMDPPEGFGTQTIYGSQGTHSFRVGDYDAVTIPWGYHPVSAMPGYSLYYLWFLAGEGRELRPNTDPRYRWLER